MWNDEGHHFVTEGQEKSASSTRWTISEADWEALGQLAFEMEAWLYLSTWQGRRRVSKGKSKVTFIWKKKKTEILERSLVEKTGTRRGWVLRGYQSRLRRRQQDTEVRFCWGFTADRVLRRYRNKGEVRSMYLTVEEWIRALSCSPLFSADGFFCDLSEFMTLVAVCMYVIYCLNCSCDQGYLSSFWRLSGYT